MEWGDRLLKGAIAFPLQAVSVAERIVADVEAVLDGIKACGNDLAAVGNGSAMVGNDSAMVGNGSAVVGNNFEGSKDVQMLVGVRVTNRVGDRHKFLH
jgi:hypothetical protein